MFIDAKSLGRAESEMRGGDVTTSPSPKNAATAKGFWTNPTVSVAVDAPISL
jgi:hypothetical protein